MDEKKRLINSEKHGDMIKSDFASRDLLSNLREVPTPMLRPKPVPQPLISGSIAVRANMSSDLKSDQRMTDEEVLSQIPVFVSLPRRCRPDAQ